jgi:hypothetical protein
MIITPGLGGTIATSVTYASVALTFAVLSSHILHAFMSSNVVPEKAATNGISASMTLRWPTHAAVLKWRGVVMAAAAASSQILREAVDTDGRGIRLQW